MRIHTFILNVIIILIITSCEKIIEVDQPDIIEQEQAFDDKNSTRLSLIGLYGLMADLVEPMFLAGEVRADLVEQADSVEIRQSLLHGGHEGFCVVFSGHQSLCLHRDDIVGKSSEFDDHACSDTGVSRRLGD